MHSRRVSYPSKLLDFLGASRRLRLAFIFVATAILINLFYLGEKPFAVNLVPTPWDKLAHFGIFSALTLLLWMGTAGRMVMGIVIVSGLFGGLDEIHQLFLPGRSADLTDWLADVAGSNVTAIGLTLWLKTRTQV